ncbi:putative lipase [Aspergillus rambellii]|uniref:Putative lipase n=1 Tax=Aspergillus rambellii TaxID=308745 RepID=A0A0F8UW25_9EURO|nr:putative lipase [Aspergillus rambellii]
MSIESDITPPYPLHDSVKDLLDPEYVAFYNQYVIDKQQVHLQPVEASRASGILIPGGGPLLEVGKTQDLSLKRRVTDGPEIRLRAFTPKGETPACGWPVMLYFHGGGWVLGNIDTENPVCTNLCTRGNCVVVTVDYRLAPETPWPAAVHDCWEALLWLLSDGPSTLSVNPAMIATGGSSAGGNLAAIITHKALTLSPPVHFLAQLLSVPVTDNTATGANNVSYRAYEYTPALPAAKMLWYRNHYLPSEADQSHPEASPLFYKGDWSALPRALVMVGELDVLRAEGEQYAEKLRQAGVEVDLQVMKGMPHPFLAMDAVLKEGKRSITLMCDLLAEVFWGAPERFLGLGN